MRSNANVTRRLALRGPEAIESVALAHRNVTYWAKLMTLENIQGTLNTLRTWRRSCAQYCEQMDANLMNLGISLDGGNSQGDPRMELLNGSPHASRHGSYNNPQREMRLPPDSSRIRLYRFTSKPEA